MIEFQLRRDDITRSRAYQATPPRLADGDARMRIDLFSLTANNVTYAAMGEGMLGYWDFFPAIDGWGRPPCWGFATVETSKAPGLVEGTRFWGYFPVGTHLDVTPVHVSEQGFTDGAPHRQTKAPVYNRYFAIAGDPSYVADREAEQTLFRPLYATGWWAADCIVRGDPPPRSAVLSSASSKTALSTAHQLRRLSDIVVVGLTSARNRSFVESTGLYDRTVVYDEIAGIAVEGAAVYVDFLGRRDVTAQIHRQLGSALIRSLTIGITDWNAMAQISADNTSLEGVTPEFFFVPDYMAGRVREEGQALGARMVEDMRAFYGASNALVRPVITRGIPAVETSWRQLTSGEVPPDVGHVHGW